MRTAQKKENAASAAKTTAEKSSTNLEGAAQSK
jgi:hypothetical protein